MKKLLIIPIMIIFCASVTAQKKIDKIQVSSKVVVQNGTINLKAVKSDLNSKNAEALKLLNEIQALVNTMPVEIKTDDKKKEQEFQTMFENFDQKVNQLFNILSTASKTAKEAESSVVDNIN